MKTLLINTGILLMAVLLTQCLKNEIPDTNKDMTKMENLDIPDDFNFETEMEVTLDLSSMSKKAAGEESKYTVFLWDESLKSTETVQNAEGEDITVDYNNYTKLRAGAYSSIGLNSISLEIPNYITKLYIVNDEMGKMSSKLVDITGFGQKSLVSANLSKAIDANDVFHLSGGSSVGRASYHTLNDQGVSTEYSIAPEGTSPMYMTFDSKNNLMYHMNYGGGSETGVIKHYIGSDTYEALPLAATYYNVQNIAFNTADNKLYGFSYGSGDPYIPRLHRFNTDDGSIEKTWSLNEEFYNVAGMAFNATGTLYMVGTGADNNDNLLRIVENIAENTGETCSLSGSLEVTDPNSFFFMLNGMDFGSDDKLYALTDGGGVSVGTIDLITGVFTEEFTHDGWFSGLGIFKTDVAKFTDSDADGAKDYYDEYPDEPKYAFNHFFPSDLEGWVTVIVEDLWPSKGDYDYNDMIVAYRLHFLKNADNNIVEARNIIKLVHKGGSFKNGFGMRATQITPADVESYTGAHITESYLNFAANGLEANQTQPFMFAFDNMHTLETGQEVEIVYTLNNPIPFIGYRPFAIINGERGRELWRPWGRPSALADQSIFGTFDDDTNPAEGKYYKSKDNAPWMLLLYMQDYAVPKEKTSILEAYPRFRNWAESAGAEDKEWYKYPDETKVQD